MNPYDLNHREAIEFDLACELLATQEDSTAQLHAAVAACRAVIAALDFPLRFPAPGHDIEDVLATLDDCLKPADPMLLDGLAFEQARGQLRGDV
jgi:hypothetical protein